ncbi:TPA: hypothetical protein ACPXMY_000521 [Vibrio metoecus]
MMNRLPPSTPKWYEKC